MNQGQAHCQRCKKAVATVHLTEIERGEKRERHLCDRCAAEEGVKVQQQHVSLNELLTSFVIQQSGVQQLAQMTCAQCGTTFADFRNAGLLGCPACYDGFEKALIPLMERAHGGATRHIGKSPRANRAPRPDRTQELERLRRELDAAIKNENFEQAAQLRDALKSLGEK